MSKQQLQTILSDVERFDDPRTDLEQYMTPASVAADIAHRLGLMVDEAAVADLGCGTGMLSLAAGLEGFEVCGYDCDPKAIETARKNKEMIEEKGFDIDVMFEVRDVLDEGVDDADCVVMNPPFGMYADDANMKFLAAAFEAAPTVLSLLHCEAGAPDETRSFIKRFASRHGFGTTPLRTYEIALPRTRSFHGSAEHAFAVDLYLFEEDDTDGYYSD